MSLTDYHAKYLAFELTKRCPSDSVEKLASVLADAQVDLNPHQVEAALFAFRSPFSKGAILADEVGLGKTIEAGLLIAQKWAERKRRLLVILPANLRKQWSQELEDKFYLSSVILETRSFNEAIRAGNLNPFQQDAIVLCSYQFARTKEPYLRQTAWDLVVIDEAHRLRNVYKNSSKIALAIKQAVAPFPKLLLTATPLQNSLLELYGLVSIIDDFAFGDLQSYRSRFSRLGDNTDFAELKERLAPHSRPRSTSWTRRSRRRRRLRASPRRCRRNWSGSAKRGASRESVTKPGAPLTRRAARSTGRRTRCWMKLADGWNSESNKRPSSPYGGVWSDCARPVHMVTFMLL